MYFAAEVEPMNDRSRAGAAHRLGFMIPLILFVLMFALCCAALSGLFVRSLDISNEAGRLSDAVAICRSQAERFRAGCELPAKMYFDENYRETDASSARYLLEVSVTTEETAAGAMAYANLTAAMPDGEPIYTIQTARYVPVGR